MKCSRIEEEGAVRELSEAAESSRDLGTQNCLSDIATWNHSDSRPRRALVKGGCRASQSERSEGGLGDAIVGQALATSVRDLSSNLQNPYKTRCKQCKSVIPALPQ